MRDSLVAINIINTKHNNIINLNAVPLLFYWNGKDDIINSLQNDKDFYNFVCEKCMNVNDYSYTNIAYFFFRYIDEKEEYHDNILSIQDVFPLANMDEHNRLFIQTYLLEIFRELYHTSMGQQYNEDILFNVEYLIYDMYTKIQEKFTNKFVKESCFNYVRSELIKKYDLTQSNCDIIIGYLEKIIESNTVDGK